MLGSLTRLASRSFARYHVRGIAVSAWRRAVDITSEDDFQKKVIQSEIPVIVDFYATSAVDLKSG